jgi:hypothetical protein
MNERRTVPALRTTVLFTLISIVNVPWSGTLMSLGT